MSHRAAILLLEDGQVALIERHRQGLHYFTFPGGHVEEGESPDQAAVREAAEELGLQVRVGRLVAKIWWHDQPQYYYLADVLGGVFGTGTGEEMLSPGTGSGTYTPVRVPLEGLLDLPIKPHRVAEMLVQAQTAGWPDDAAEIREGE